MRPDGPRDPIVGPDGGPEPPFPIKLSGEVIKGFGRGSKELGIPTANIPIEGLAVGGHPELQSGVYFGWAGLDFHSPGAPKTHDPHDPHAHHHHGGGGLGTRLRDATAKVADVVGAVIAGDEDDGAEEGFDGKGRVHPMVMSVGWNPYYKNEKRSVEVHIMHEFAGDFYGSRMNLIMLGFIRPEYDYVSKESLIEDIKVDIEVSGRSLARKNWARFRRDPYLLTFPEEKGEEKHKA